MIGQPLGGIGPRERRWLLAFLILGAAYFGVLLLQIAFTTDADTRMLVLRVARMPAGSPIRGKLWIDDFRLVEKSQAEDHS